MTGQRVTLLVAKVSAAASQSQTTLAAHLLLWLLLAVTGCLLGNVEAEPSVGWILPPNGAPGLICDALDLGSDKGWCQPCWGSPPTPCQEPRDDSCCLSRLHTFLSGTAL